MIKLWLTDHNHDHDGDGHDNYDLYDHNDKIDDRIE